MEQLSLLEFEAYIERTRREIEERISEKISNRSDAHIIRDAISGGKRLRSILLMLTFDALGGKDRDTALDIACALELAHNASLIHDDIIDGDIERRGAPTLWRKVGIAKAIIHGHRIINLAFQTVLEKGTELARIFLKAWDDASRGILDEIFSSEPFSEKLYKKIVREKTASLFIAATECAAIIAGADEKLRKLLRDYGEAVGIAYQIADDYVDVLKKRMNVRMPILMLRQLEEAIKAFYIAFKLKKPVLPFRSLLMLDRPVLVVKKEMDEYLNKATSIASSLAIPDSPYKEMLQIFPRYCVNLMLRELKLS